MTIIIGKVVLECPETGKQVQLHKDCKECGKLRHYGFKGYKVAVTCKSTKPPAKSVFNRRRKPF